MLDYLTRRGAQFVSEIAIEAGLEPSRVREALDSLLRKGQVTNDRFDPLRPSGRAMVEALAQAPPRDPRDVPAWVGVASLPGGCLNPHPEGRWSLVPGRGATEGDETALLAWAAALLERYGVLTRETAALDSLGPALASTRSRSWPGPNGAASCAAVTLSRGSRACNTHWPRLPRNSVDRRADPVRVEPKAFLISTLDPANLYGSGAPFDVPLLEGGTARVPRSAGNFLVLMRGDPS